MISSSSTILLLIALKNSRVSRVQAFANDFDTKMEEVTAAAGINNITNNDNLWSSPGRQIGFAS
jgi:hypothetical protein